MGHGRRCHARVYCFEYFLRACTHQHQLFESARLVLRKGFHPLLGELRFQGFDLALYINSHFRR
jgi:hypothetical protein